MDADHEPKKAAVQKIDALLDDSRQIAAHATDFEDHNLTVWQTVRRNPWATLWCIYACWAVILVAFEGQAGGAVIGIPEFRKDFGYEFPEGSGSYVIPATWQSAFSGAPLAS